jgi:hypothetical protein
VQGIEGRDQGNPERNRLEVVFSLEPGGALRMGPAAAFLMVRVNLSSSFHKYRNEFFLTAEAQRAQRRHILFDLALRGRQIKSRSNGSRDERCASSSFSFERGFPGNRPLTDSQEKSLPPRPLRLRGEYVAVFMKECTKLITEGRYLRIDMQRHCRNKPGTESAGIISLNQWVMRRLGHKISDEASQRTAYEHGQFTEE